MNTTISGKEAVHHWFIELVLICMSIVVLIGAPVLSLAGCWWLYKSWQVSAWPQTEGVVLHSELKIYKPNNQVTGYTIQYSYSVDGNTYRSNKISPGLFSQPGQDEYRDVVNQYPASSHPRVYYNPDDPTESYLDEGYTIAAFIIPITPWLFFALFFQGLKQRVRLVRERRASLAGAKDLFDEHLEISEDTTRSGRFLVMREDAVLPKRCAICNTDVDLNQKTINYFNVPRWFFCFLLICPLAAQVGVALEMTAGVQLWFCCDHARMLRRRKRLPLYFFFAGFATFAFAVLAGIAEMDAVVPVLLWAGISLVVLSPFVLIYGGLFRSFTRIESPYVFVKDVGPAYLEQFPVRANTP